MHFITHLGVCERAQGRVRGQERGIIHSEILPRKVLKFRPHASGRHPGPSSRPVLEPMHELPHLAAGQYHRCISETVTIRLRLKRRISSIWDMGKGRREIRRGAHMRFQVFWG